MSTILENAKGLMDFVSGKNLKNLKQQKEKERSNCNECKIKPNFSRKHEERTSYEILPVLPQ